MPARSVVIEKLSKFTGEHHEFLTPGEYTQLAGRAGRRGIDDVGYVVVLWDPFVPFEQVAGLASRRTYALTSSFHPTYNMAANLVQRYPPQQARHLLNLSFAQFHADRDVVAVERDLELRRGQLAEAEAAAVHPAGDVDEYRRLLAELDAAPAGRARPVRRPVRDPAAGRRADRAQARRQGRGAEAGAGERAAAGPGADPGEVARAALAARLPRPVAQGRDDRAARGRSRRAASRSRRPRSRPLRRLKVRDVELPVDTDGDVEELAGRGRRAPAAQRARCRRRRCAPRGRPTGSPATSPASSAGCRRAATASPGSSTACSACSTWGYVEDWTLTDAGRLLTRLNSEGELVIAEALREGRLDGIDPATMAAVVSCFTFQRRGPGQQRAAAAAPLAEPGGRAPQPGARRASGATCTSPSARPACPRPAGPIRVSRPPSTPG